MFFEILIIILLGVLAGTFTGLIPGVHSNNVVYFLSILNFHNQNFIYFIVSMVITQSFIDFIPSIYLGAPSTDTFAGVLPGHKLFLNGEGHLAITLSVFGGVIAIIVSVLVLPLLQQFLFINNTKIIFLIPFVLISSSIILMLDHNTKKKKFLALIIFLLAASQGILFKDQIFPLITGYFGVATILYSNKKNNLIKQKTNAKIDIKLIKEGLIGLIGGAAVSIFPGIGNNLAATIIKIFRKKINSKNYLVLLGSINTSNFFFSIPVLFILNKARNGAAIFLQKNIIFDQQIYFYIIITMILSGSLSAILTIYISKYFSKKLFKINFKKLNYLIILLIIIFVFAFNGILGIITLFFSTTLGLFTTANKIKRSICLASLIVPVLLFYLFILT